MKRITPVLASCILMLLLSMQVSNASAQPFNLNDNIIPVELTLQEYHPADSAKRGMISVSTVEQTTDTMYFFVRNLSMYSPVYFQVFASGSTAPLDVSLHKENWLKALQSGNTADKKYWETRFRTEGDFGIRVHATSLPAKYTVLVWEGKEANIKMPSPFVGYDKAKGGGFMAMLKAYWMYVLIALLVVAVVFLLVKRKK